MTNLSRENIQAYPKPPVMGPMPQRVTVCLGGQVIALETRATTLGKPPCADPLHST